MRKLIEKGSDADKVLAAIDRAGGVTADRVKMMLPGVSGGAVNLAIIFLLENDYIRKYAGETFRKFPETDSVLDIQRRCLAVLRRAPERALRATEVAAYDSGMTPYQAAGGLQAMAEAGEAASDGGNGNREKFSLAQGVPAVK